MSAFFVLSIGIVFIIVAIAGFKMHPFFALILAAILVGILSPQDLPRTDAEQHLPQATMALREVGRAFGRLAGGIGIVIAMAAVIGQALMESGAADKITRRLLGVMGEKRANYALLSSGYVLSIPVFFDTVFFLLVPLARALRMRTGRHYLAYLMAICAGAALTHSLVPPTPGPLLMASEENLNIPLGEAIAGGFLLGLPIALIGGILLPKWMVRWVDPPLRDAPGATTEQLRAIVAKPEDELPSFVAAILPVALPIVLITVHSIVSTLYGNEGLLPAITSFLGDKLFAMGLGTACALWLLYKQRGYSLSELTQSLEPALMAAGTIILITCAGGAFGSMLKGTGLDVELKALIGSVGEPGTLILLISWGTAAVMKIAQGSGTVAMVTAAGIMTAIIGDMTLPYHKIYVFAAIAFGSKFVSWMNDSGFWVVSKMSGLTQEETLKSWSLLLAVMGVIGLIEVLILSRLLPLV